MKVMFCVKDFSALFVRRREVLFSLGFAVSLLLHALILMLPTPFSTQLTEAVAQSSQRLNLRLRTPERYAATQPAVVPQAIESHLARQRGQKMRRLPPLAQKIEGDELQKPGSPIASSFNMEDLRAQARRMAPESRDDLVQGSGADQKANVQGVPGLLDRPMLDALSRRIGKPLVVMEERVMNDGSRKIRFASNLCMHIPRFLNGGMESQFVPTMFVPMLCPK